MTVNLSLIAQLFFAILFVISGVMMVSAQIRLLHLTRPARPPESSLNPVSLIGTMFAMTRHAKAVASEPQASAPAEAARRAYRGWQATMLSAMVALALVGFLMPR